MYAFVSTYSHSLTFPVCDFSGMSFFDANEIFDGKYTSDLVRFGMTPIRSNTPSYSPPLPLSWLFWQDHAVRVTRVESQNEYLKHYIDTCIST